jgi:hypothetical protein
MFTQAIIATGLGLLIVAGIYQLSTARLAGTNAKRDQLISKDSTTFTRADFTDPTNVLDDGGKLRNAVIVVMETAAIVMAVWMTIFIYTASSVSMALKLLVIGVLVVGTFLVGRGLYVRMGMYQPVTLAESLRSTVGPDVADDFSSIRTTLDAARGDDPVEETTAGLLAAARNDRSMDDLQEWARVEDVADPATLENRVETLAEAGLIHADDGQLSVDPQFADADDDQLITVATTVLD